MKDGPFEACQSFGVAALNPAPIFGEVRFPEKKVEKQPRGVATVTAAPPEKESLPQKKAPPKKVAPKKKSHVYVMIEGPFQGGF